MPELKFAKKRHLRRFEREAPKEKRVEFQRLTSNYSRRSTAGLIIMAAIVAFMIYYLSKV
ncbi:MAG: hypothetical protein K9M49_06470 [Candidatus Marinimicrobia bacterium]|nr:hypothetical protein [Candidatus Neomarinimicrobiota bacterium]MCF7904781.1 hypothetical protein [Candidatus Neomarinimicrobiota bacterium]